MVFDVSMMSSVLDMGFSIGIWILTGVVLLVSYIVYIFLPIHYTYWKDLGVPYISRSLKDIFLIFRKPIHEIELDHYQKCGRIYGVYEGRNKPTLTLAEPEVLKQILVKDFHLFVNRRKIDLGDQIMDNMVSVLQGEQWKRVRTIITPAFTTGKIKRMKSIITDSAKQLCEQLLIDGSGNKPIEMKKIFGNFTMDVIASSAFGTKINSYKDPDNPFVMNARKISGFKINWKVFVAFFAPKLFKFLRISAFDEEVTTFFRDVTLKLVKERRNSKQVHNDFLQLMMDAGAEYEKQDAAEKAKTSKHIEERHDLDKGHDEGNAQVFKKSTTYKTLNQDELLAQCILFFLVGFDTTATTLAIATYFLAVNPDCQEKLITEVDAVLKANQQGELTYEAIQSMAYLDKFLAETLRLHPIAIRIERTASEDYELGISNITLKKGMIVGIPVYAMHHDPEFYPDPEKFYPERFAPEEKERRHPYTYLPFGAGPRNCLGMRFALMEMKICLAYLVSQLRFKRLPETKVPLEFNAAVSQLQPKDLFIGVEKRTDLVH